MSRPATPGLTVGRAVRVKRWRRLPMDGQVLVSEGDRVAAEDVVARAEIPGVVHRVSAAARLGVPRSELSSTLRVKSGDPVAVGQLLAENRSLFGLITRRLESPVDGTLESISATTGQLMIREASQALELRAFISGTVTDVEPGRGAQLEARVAQVQGIFGLGGEVFGELAVPQGADDLTGRVALVREALAPGAIEDLRDRGAVAVVAPSADGADLVGLAGGKLNPSSTGDEAVGITVVLTEGFGGLSMAPATAKLLGALVGQRVAVSGATQVRAGVIRPEIVAACREDDDVVAEGPSREPLARIVRGAHFGAVGKIVDSPGEMRVIGSGAVALVVEIAIEGGERVTVPRANVELLV